MLFIYKFHVCDHDRFSPLGHFKLAKSEDTEDDTLNLSSAMWFDYILYIYKFDVCVTTFYVCDHDRFSPFGQFKLAQFVNTEEDALNLSSALWLNSTLYIYIIHVSDHFYVCDHDRFSPFGRFKLAKSEDTV